MARRTTVVVPTQLQQPLDMIDNLNITIWNIRGLNLKDKQLDVQAELRRTKLDIFLLLATKIKRNNLEAAMKKVWPRGAFISNHDGIQGGELLSSRIYNNSWCTY